MEETFDPAWQHGLIYMLPKLTFLPRKSKLISKFLSQRKYSLGRRRNIYTKIYASRGVTRFRRFCPVHIIQIGHKRYSVIYLVHAHLTRFADDICVYATDSKEGYVFTKLQRGLNTLQFDVKAEV
jgi:hypothetical protein